VGNNPPFLLHLGFVFTSDEGSATIGVVVFITEGLGWLTRWISPDSAGAVDGLNLYVYVGNNPLKYRDPTGHFPLISWDRFVSNISALSRQQSLPIRSELRVAARISIFIADSVNSWASF
jgi:hypothetical protein